MAFKLIVTIGLVVLVMVFAVQNAATVEIRFLFLEVAIPRSLLIFLMLMIGVVIGWFSRSIYRITRRTD